MTCNHDHITTPFCPKCGAEISASPLQQLGAYLINQTRRRQREMERHVRQESHPRSIARMNKNYQKWKSWTDAFQELTKDQP